MKKIITFILLLFLVSGEAFGYTIKLYNQKGYMIGTAHKNGDNYEIYDLDGHRVTDYDAFYASEGDMNKKQMKQSKNFITTDNGFIKVSAIDRYIYRNYNPYLVKPLSIKVYDKTGKFVGYAKTNGKTDFIIYNKDGDIISPKETLYSPPGTPLKSFYDKIPQIFLDEAFNEPQ